MARSLLCCLLLILLAIAHAQSAGDNVFQFGWIHVHPQESNKAPRNRLRSSPIFPLLGVEESFRSESVRISASSTDTLGLIFKHYFTDHWVLNFTGGIPRKAALSARGIVGPTGPTRPANSLDIGREEFNPVGSARQWSPILMAEYHFRKADAAWRPYLGVGFTYAFFTEIELNDNFEAAINRQFGAPLALALAAGRPGPTETTSDVKNTFAAAFSAGLNLRLSEHWGLTGAITFLPLQTTGTVTINSQDGTRLASSKTRLQFDPIVFSLLAGYQF